MKHQDILKQPILTEKAYRLQEEENTYSFEVHKDANKPQIREAVEQKFDVVVDSVRTMRTPGKKKGFRFEEGETPEQKKALVKLDQDYRIDLLKS